MQQVVFEKPYEFIPPHRGRWLPRLIQIFELYRYYLKGKEGVIDYEIRHVERLNASLSAGHGIMLTPNHCRYADPLAMGFIAKECNVLLYTMASWHLFNQGWFNSWAVRTMGGFSIYREGVDRKSIDTAVEVLATAERPLVIFPEGAVSRTNDRLQALLDGVAFIARTGAKKRARAVEGGKVVIHPIAFKYVFQGKFPEAILPTLRDLESRLTWHVQSDRPLLERVIRIGRALLTLKELEYFGEPQDGDTRERIERLVDRLLGPLEEEWLGVRKSGHVVPRVKNLRMKILPDMVEKRVDEAERARRWRQLHDIYLAQQVSCYQPDYLVDPTIERILETVERYEEDLTDNCRRYEWYKAVIEIGEAIEVSPERDRSAPVDPLMASLEGSLRGMIERLALEGTPWRGE